MTSQIERLIEDYERMGRFHDFATALDGPARQELLELLRFRRLSVVNAELRDQIEQAEQEVAALRFKAREWEDRARDMEREREELRVRLLHHHAVGTPAVTLEDWGQPCAVCATVGEPEGGHAHPFRKAEPHIHRPGDRPAYSGRGSFALAHTHGGEPEGEGRATHEGRQNSGIPGDEYRCPYCGSDERDVMLRRCQEYCDLVADVGGSTAPLRWHTTEPQETVRQCDGTDCPHPQLHTTEPQEGEK